MASIRGFESACDLSRVLAGRGLGSCSAIWGATWSKIGASRCGGRYAAWGRLSQDASGVQ